MLRFRRWNVTHDRRDDVHALRSSIVAWRLALVTALAVTLASLALGQDDAASRVARWTVEPLGDQVFDLLTGETSLPDGGTIVDAVTGLVLQAGFVTFVEGVSIDAETVRADLAGGRIEASRLSIDVVAGVATVADGVRFSTSALVIEADGARFLLDVDLARFDAPRGVTPVLEGGTLFLDVASGAAVLTGPYRFVQGIVTFRDDSDTATLMLETAALADGSITYQAANVVEEDLWERFAPLR